LYPHVFLTIKISHNNNAFYCISEFTLHDMKKLHRKSMLTIWLWWILR